MRYYIFVAYFFVGIFQLIGQEEPVKEVDSLYKEDQFYAGITYNLLANKPQDISQSGFSLGFQLGFIKDMPINKRRNVAIGLGLGYSANSFNQNLLISRSNNDITYTQLDANTFTKNKFSTHLVEMPFEFRWRNSTPSVYNFWRVYAGFKLAYMVTHTTKYNGELGAIRFSNIDDFNKFQYGLTLTLGYNTWNLHLYYGLSPVFSKEALLGSQVIDMNVVKLGLMFYVL